ncbi:MAG: glutaredoxin domain-containing protein [Gammaproteobacteria bacterium]|jgi:glutaredoxin
MLSARRSTALFALLSLFLLWRPDAAMADAPGCGNITVYVSKTCPHCAAAKAFLAERQSIAPLPRITYREVTGDPLAREQLMTLSARHGIDRPGVPMFDICGRVLVGFNEPELIAALSGSMPEQEAVTTVSVPMFGELNATMIGLPLFTVAIGLVDGFNPCAMWVLLFLLSILVNVRRRDRIILIAGTFVVVSGVVYFLFMAAWLNVFLIAGYSRAIQIVLGVIALVVGGVHVKDFFALHRGVSLGIPASIKPAIYGRVRRIVQAENLPVAVAATLVLAVLVNVVELLCTAGLPALYTQVLSRYELPAVSYYLYLVLYNIAYMADDAAVVAIAVVTLGHRRLQEREGRWLKLLSGGFIIVLGAILIFAPETFLF